TPARAPSQRTLAAVQCKLEALRERAVAGERVALLRWTECPLRLEGVGECLAAGQTRVAVARLDADRVRPVEAELVGVDLEEGRAVAVQRIAALPARGLGEDLPEVLVRPRVQSQEVDEVPQLVGDREPADPAAELFPIEDHEVAVARVVARARGLC